MIIGFGGNYGDCGTYHGWVVGVSESGTGSLLAYQVPTANQGAIWAPAGVTVNGAGDIFVVTGNGGAQAGQPFDHGDSVIELSPALAELQYFAPSNWVLDNSDDGDLGSTAAILLDGTRLFIVGKEQTAYLLDTTTLGGIGGQLASISLCNSRGGNAYLAPDAYVVCTNNGTIEQVGVGPGATMLAGLDVDIAHGGGRFADDCRWCVVERRHRRICALRSGPVHGDHPFHLAPHDRDAPTLCCSECGGRNVGGGGCEPRRGLSLNDESLAMAGGDDGDGWTTSRPLAAIRQGSDEEGFLDP